MLLSISCLTPLFINLARDVGYYVDQTAQTYLNRCLCALCHHLVPDYAHPIDNLPPRASPSVDCRPYFIDRERDVWDQLGQQKDLLANANRLLSARSVKVEDLRLRCADMKTEAAMAWEQVTPMAARVKKLEEELTRVAGERDAFFSRAEEATVSAKAIAAQLGEEQGAHALTKGTLDEALKATEASRVDALAWKGKFEGEFCSLYFTCFSCVRPLTP